MAVWFVLAAGVVPAVAHAYSDEPLCALRTPEPALVLRAPQTATVPLAEARWALARAEELITQGRLADALLPLRLVELAAPSVRDRIALRRAELLLRLQRPADARAAYELAAQSPERNVAAQARIGLVRSLLEAGSRDSEEALAQLSRRYPNLTDRAALRLALGRARERWGQTHGAIAVYRGLDLLEPETDAAADARAALARLRDAGVVVRDYTAQEQVERAERLVLRGTVEAGRTAVAELLAQPKLPVTQRGRAQLLAARVARVEGRWDEVRGHVNEALKLGVPGPEALRLLPRGAAASAAPRSEDGRAAASARVQKLLSGRPMEKLQNPQLRAVLDLAVDHRVSEAATEALYVMAGRASLAPAVRFDAAMRAGRIASDRSVAELLATVMTVPSFAVSGRYHYARALERMGRLGEAEAHYLAVVDQDRSQTRYYAMWADLRLWAMQSAQRQSCLPQAGPRGEADRAVDALLPARDVAPAQAPRPALAAADKREAVVAALDPVASAHGAAFVWLERARTLAELELFSDAADELVEAYHAYRDARGELRLRAGLEAVLTGTAPARHLADFATRRQRLSLDATARAQLATAADLLGDPGVALRLRGERGEVRPRAYGDAVLAAASRHGVDPNLLFAVMRVESIYHRQIVSYAGAVGLMQIMPRTGMLIARKLGVDRFDVSRLLDPQTNVEFAAWYLSSLLARFDGNLPLAIAAYNGGPHNVRLWMRQDGPEIPLDAFLERIPFEQTHRYVRRVLTHYAAYRAQQHLPMTRLPVALPSATPDSVAF